MCHTCGNRRYTDTVSKSCVYRHTTHNTAQTKNTKIKNKWFVEIQCSGNKQHNNHGNNYHSVNTKKETSEKGR